MTSLYFIGGITAPPAADRLGWQVVWLFVLALPVACLAWTVTHEEIFREPRDYCVHKSKACRRLLSRKFFYLFTCEYCFSHWISLLFLLMTGFRLLLDNWLGSVIAFFSLVLVANAYMSLYARLRVDIRSERAQADAKQKEAEVSEKQIEKLNIDIAEKSADIGRPPAI